LVIDQPHFSFGSLFPCSFSCSQPSGIFRLPSLSRRFRIFFTRRYLARPRHRRAVWTSAERTFLCLLLLGTNVHPPVFCLNGYLYPTITPPRLNTWARLSTPPGSAITVAEGRPSSPVRRLLADSHLFLQGIEPIVMSHRLSRKAFGRAWGGGGVSFPPSPWGVESAILWCGEPSRSGRRAGGGRGYTSVGLTRLAGLYISLPFPRILRSTSRSFFLGRMGAFDICSYRAPSEIRFADVSWVMGLCYPFISPGPPLLLK